MLQNVDVIFKNWNKDEQITEDGNPRVRLSADITMAKTIGIS